MDKDDLVFDGKSSLTVDAFIRAIGRRLLDKGLRQKDPLAADLAAACLGGEALQWFLELSSDVAEDWRGLQKEMLRRWSSGTVPTPAYVRLSQHSCSDHIPTYSNSAAAPRPFSALVNAAMHPTPPCTTPLQTPTGTPGVIEIYERCRDLRDGMIRERFAGYVGLPPRDSKRYQETTVIGFAAVFEQPQHHTYGTLYEVDVS